MSLERLSELLFDNSEEIPNGVYLSLMNELRDIHRARQVVPPPPPPPQPEATRSVLWLNYEEKFSNTDTDNFFQVNIYVNNAIEVLTGDKYTREFWLVDKKNHKTIVFSVYRWNLRYLNPENTWFKLDTIVEKRKKTIPDMKKEKYRYVGGSALFNKLRNSTNGYYPIDKMREFQFEKIKPYIAP